MGFLERLERYANFRPVLDVRRLSSPASHLCDSSCFDTCMYYLYVSSMYSLFQSNTINFVLHTRWNKQAFNFLFCFRTYARQLGLCPHSAFFYRTFVVSTGYCKGAHHKHIVMLSPPVIPPYVRKTKSQTKTNFDTFEQQNPQLTPILVFLMLLKTPNTVPI